MSDALIRVAVADDQPLFASGVGMLVEAQDDMLLVGTVGDGQSAVALAESHEPDVMVMDLRMPGMNGLEATRRIVEAGSSDGPRIVVLTTLQSDHVVYEALRAGASAFLTKDALPELLVGTIRAAATDETTAAGLDPVDIIGRFSSRSAPGSEVDAWSSLTDREREVFRLVAQGRGNAEIAGRLWITEATVKSHVRAILAKLRLQGRVQLIVFAYEHGLALPAAPRPQPH